MVDVVAVNAADAISNLASAEASGVVSCDKRLCGHARYPQGRLKVTSYYGRECLVFG
jgi:hypothetical protein